jgi:hypothetical protein
MNIKKTEKKMILDIKFGKILGKEYGKFLMYVNHIILLPL